MIRYLTITIIAVLIATKASAQFIYFSGNLELYSFAFKYKGDYPYPPTKYYGFNFNRPNFNIGYTKNERDFFELNYKRTPYRLHHVAAFQQFPLSNGPTWLKGPGYYLVQADAYGSHDLSLRYKRSLLSIGKVKLTLLTGISVQLHPYFERVRGAQWPIELDSTIYFRKTSPTLQLLVGAEAELPLYKQLKLWGGFTQYFGFSEILITQVVYYWQTNLYPTGYRHTDGSGRAFNLGLRWYISSEYFANKGLPQNKSSQFYAGLEYGRFRSNQRLPAGVFEYRAHPLDNQLKSFGIVAGWRRAKDAWEIGFYNLPSEISYSLTPYNPTLPWERQDLNHTSKHTLYVPIRYKRALVDFGTESTVATLAATVGAGLNFAMPETFYSSKVINDAGPVETFIDNPTVFSSEVGMEASWHFWRFTLSGHARYIHSFEPSRSVDFVWNQAKPVPVTSGTITTTSTGWWTGASLRFNFLK